MSQKMTKRFGEWVHSKIDPVQVSMIDLSDYSGIHIRKLYRLLTGETALRFDDWIWLVECVSDMTNTKMTDNVTESIRYMIQ